MKVEWKKWPEKGYPNCCWVWLYNDDAVSLRRVHTLPDDLEGYYYACVDFPDPPEPPEKKLHYCFRKTCSGTYECTETKHGLELVHDSVLVYVLCCPFCGFTLGKK